MVFNIDVVLKNRDFAVSETAIHEGNDPPGWTEHDVERVLEEILRAIDRATNPGADERPVYLRGFSWIVEPSEDRVVIAIEIPTAAAVAGPFDIEQARLDRLIKKVVELARDAVPGSTRVH